MSDLLEQLSLLHIINLERRIMSSLADLSTLVAKVNTDIDAKLATLNQQITDLQNQLSAYQNDQTVIDQAVADLTTADAKLS